MSGSLATKVQGFHVAYWENFVLEIFFFFFPLCCRSNHSVNSDCTLPSAKEYGSDYQRVLLIIALGFAVSFFSHIKWLYIKYISHQPGLTAFALRKPSFFPFYDPFFFLLFHIFFSPPIHITDPQHRELFYSAGSYTLKLLSSRPVSVREKGTKQRNAMKEEWKGGVQVLRPRFARVFSCGHGSGVVSSCGISDMCSYSKLVEIIKIIINST